MPPVKSAVLSQPTSHLSNSSHLNQVLELLRTLMEYRSAEVRQRLEKVGREASMLHMDVLLLIYHFARYGAGNVLEIGPYVGGSTIAATAKRVRKLLLHREEIDRLYGETQVKGRALVVLPDRIQ